MRAAKDFNKVNAYGSTPLFLAIERGDIVGVDRMLAAGADVMAKTKRMSGTQNFFRKAPYAEGSTPLHAAALAGMPHIVALLLRHDADPNAQNVSRRTPLDEAIDSYAHYKTATSKKSFFSLSGPRTQRNLQKISTYREIIRTLIAHGAKPGLYAVPKDIKDAPQP